MMIRAWPVAADSTKRLQQKQEDELLEAKEDEMEALASSLQLSISVGQEATRDTDTLLKSLKISEVRVVNPGRRCRRTSAMPQTVELDVSNICDASNHVTGGTNGRASTGA